MNGLVGMATDGAGDLSSGEAGAEHFDGDWIPCVSARFRFMQSSAAS